MTLANYKILLILTFKKYKLWINYNGLNLGRPIG